MTGIASLLVTRRGADAPGLPDTADLDRLARADHPLAPALATAIRETIAGTVHPDEAPHVDAIEARRAALEASGDPVSYMDYGALTRDGRETAAEMYQGRRKHRTVGDLCRRTSKPYRSGLLLMKLLRALGPAAGLEMGTCLGISAAYQAAGLVLSGAPGRLVTVDGAQDIAPLAAATLQALGHGRIDQRVGRFQDILDRILAEVAPLDYAFIDGHHDGPATVDYHGRVAARARPGAVLAFDDIRWSQPMLEAWQTIIAGDGIALTVDLGDIGLVVLRGGNDGSRPAEQFRLP